MTATGKGSNVGWFDTLGESIVLSKCEKQYENERQGGKSAAAVAAAVAERQWGFF